ncbi:hypothetical protein [Sporosalibacterium faouarense]|uniref:hypothetical protein n=1 Tax=Sporosalibacterium faouarense TaxID=516123 RepID=UPI00192AD364|nr:hypothetical protein [Sporosalibacterium faouarense]
MKKYFIIVTLMLTVLLGGCTANNENVDALLYTKGLDLVHRMDIMAENDKYIDLMFALTQVGENIREIGKGNYSKPNEVYKITIPKGLEIYDFVGSDMTGIPEEIKTEVEKRFIATISSRVNALNGSLVLAASSAITSSDSFISEGLDNNTLYIYLYEGKYSAIVSFYPGNENIVGASANFVLSDSLNQVSSDSEMLEWLKKYASLVDCEVEKVE